MKDTSENFDFPAYDLDVTTSNKVPAAFEQLWPAALCKTNDLFGCGHSRNHVVNNNNNNNATFV